jgi:hypothetical protein
MCRTADSGTAAMPPTLRWTSPLIFTLTAACATPATTAAPVWIAQSVGTRQCEEAPLNQRSGQVALAALRDAGLVVSASACGTDGRMRPAVCGAGDGRLVLAEIPSDQLARAQALGWVPLALMRDAQRQPCPS